jgi:hypothetical protein
LKLDELVAIANGGALTEPNVITALARGTVMLNVSEQNGQEPQGSKLGGADRGLLEMTCDDGSWAGVTCTISRIKRD